MVHRCWVVGCNNYSEKTDIRYISYFKLPLKDPERLSVWLTNIGRLDLLNSPDILRKIKNRRICNAHFEKTMLTLFKTKLKRYAIPTIFNENQGYRACKGASSQSESVRGVITKENVNLSISQDDNNMPITPFVYSNDPSEEHTSTITDVSQLENKIANVNNPDTSSIKLHPNCKDIYLDIPDLGKFKLIPISDSAKNDHVHKTPDKKEELFQNKLNKTKRKLKTAQATIKKLQNEIKTLKTIIIQLNEIKDMSDEEIMDDT